MSKEIMKDFNKLEVDIHNYDTQLESYFKEFEESIDVFKNASINDFDSLNKRLTKVSNILTEVSSHLLTHDQEIEVLKKQVRPKYEYAKKDITAPLTSTMQGVFESNPSLSPYRTRQTQNIQEMTTSEILNNRQYHRSQERDVSPNVEEIMQKDINSRRKLETLKRISKRDDSKERNSDNRRIDRIIKTKDITYKTTRPKQNYGQLQHDDNEFVPQKVKSKYQDADLTFRKQRFVKQHSPVQDIEVQNMSDSESKDQEEDEIEVLNPNAFDTLKRTDVVEQFKPEENQSKLCGILLFFIHTF